MIEITRKNNLINQDLFHIDIVNFEKLESYYQLVRDYIKRTTVLLDKNVIKL